MSHDSIKLNLDEDEKNWDERCRLTFSLIVNNNFSLC